MTITIIKNGSVKFSRISAEIRDGKVWGKINGSYYPVLAEHKLKAARIAKADAGKRMRAGKITDADLACACTMGDNGEGLEILTVEDYDARMAPIRKAEAELKAKTVRIYLSSRGWGDYSPVEWLGDITRPDAEIISECKQRLAAAYDVDHPNQSDDELLAKIAKARRDWETLPARRAAAEKAEQEDIAHKVKSGYCFNCESYCYGDCGHFSADPAVKFRRDLGEATRETNYGISD